MVVPKIAQAWDTEQYQSKHSYVWEFGSQLIDLLAIKPGETVIDLGCGTGELTKKIQDLGANIIGIDSDAQMVSKATSQFPQIKFKVDDASSFSVKKPVDKVFSNAALHWVPQAEEAVKRISEALKVGGVFVAEFGGKDNVASIVEYLENMRGKEQNPWFFPSISEYASLLESNGFELEFASLYKRPTALKGKEGLRNWILMFGQSFLVGMSSDQIEQLLRRAEKDLRASLYKNNQWIADYRRIRVLAVKKPIDSSSKK
ncbi:MAG: methyltransferase domain-containing protein [Oligoflexales bacterium]|nr:methyltransferase domain-containing protein [Oligoflexales bacterium]